MAGATPGTDVLAATNLSGAPRQLTSDDLTNIETGPVVGDQVLRRAAF